jgi:hypothetical protein
MFLSLRQEQQWELSTICDSTHALACAIRVAKFNWDPNASASHMRSLANASIRESRIAFPMAANSGERARLACWRWCPRHRELFRIDNQFSIRAMFAEWAGSVAIAEKLQGESQMYRDQFLNSIRDRLGTAAVKGQALDLCQELFLADGARSDEEDAVLQNLRKLFE